MLATADNVDGRTALHQPALHVVGLLPQHSTDAIGGDEQRRIGNILV
jgi:hypothetical protein